MNHAVTARANGIGQSSGQTAAVFGLAALTYLLTLSRNSAASHDSIGYINAIDTGMWLFHPHHLLYHPVSVLWLKLWRAAGVSADSSLVVASLNALCGAGIVACVYWLLRTRFLHSAWTALATTALVAFSFGVWFYSACVEVYIIPLFLLVLALLVLLRPRFDARSAALAGLLHGLGVLFHQAYVLVGAAACVRIYIAGTTPEQGKHRAFFLYLASAAVVVIAGYGSVLAWSVRPDSVAAGWLWFSGYAHEMPQAWRAPGPRSLAQATMGFGHSIIGGQFVFAVDWIRGLVGQALAGHELRDEAYLVRALPSWVASLLLAGSALVAATIAGLIVGSLRRLRAIYTLERSLLLPIVAWLLSFSLFFLVWEPSNLEFWIPQSVLVWLLLDRLAVDGVRRGSLVANWYRLGLPALLLAVNFFGGIVFLRSPENDYFFVRATALTRHAGSADLVITHEVWINEDYLRRFLASKVLSPDEILYQGQEHPSAAERILRELRAVLDRGGRVFVSFKPDAATVPATVPPGFIGLWKRLVEGGRLNEQEVTVENDTYWVYRRG